MKNEVPEVFKRDAARKIEESRLRWDMPSNDRPLSYVLWGEDKVRVRVKAGREVV